MRYNVNTTVCYSELFKMFGLWIEVKFKKIYNYYYVSQNNSWEKSNLRFCCNAKYRQNFCLQLKINATQYL